MLAALGVHYVVAMAVVFDVSARTDSWIVMHVSWGWSDGSLGFCCDDASGVTVPRRWGALNVEVAALKFMANATGKDWRNAQSVRIVAGFRVRCGLQPTAMFKPGVGLWIGSDTNTISLFEQSKRCQMSVELRRSGQMASRRN